MNDFWARRLNNTPPPAAPAPSTPASNTPWWATPPMVPATQPAAQPVPQQPEANMATALASNVPAPTKAKSARMTETCPDCGSSNFFGGQANTMSQCYECGYNPRFSHTTAGMGIPSDAGAPIPAKQLNPGGESNFNPGTIIAHI